mmetsp:Transcript_8860/g.23252  ORF Transcript_8860/g.23252 Transcript_8860/m.23252 type:complete len:204 (-) Transcript_8860:206-817(-)
MEASDDAMHEHDQTREASSGTSSGKDERKKRSYARSAEQNNELQLGPNAEAMDFSSLAEMPEFENMGDFKSFLDAMERSLLCRDLETASLSALDVSNVARAAQMAAQMALKAAEVVRRTRGQSSIMQARTDFMFSAATYAVESAANVARTADRIREQSQFAADGERLRSQNEWLANVEEGLAQKGTRMVDEPRTKRARDESSS